MHPNSQKLFRHVILAALLVSGSAAAKPSCYKDWVCVAPIENGDQLQFFARNLKPWPVTVSFRAKTTNLQGPRGSVTLDLNAMERVEIASYQRKVAGKRYRYEYLFDFTVGSQNPNHEENYRYELPYAKGKDWQILQGFGSRFSHTGRERYAVDFGMPVGSRVLAARGGTVVSLREHHNRGCWEDGCGKYANFVVILHPDGTTGEYYHLQKDGVLVDVGETVERGQHIANSGNTGHTTTPHLHFAVYRADTWGRTQSLPFVFANGDEVLSKPRGGQRHEKR